MSNNKTNPSCVNGQCELGSFTECKDDVKEQKTKDCNSACPESSCNTGIKECKKSLEDLCVSTLNELPQFISNFLKKKKEPARRVRIKSDSESESESSDNDSEDTESESVSDTEDEMYQTMPKWALFHQLLDSHSALCNAFVQLIKLEDEH